MSYLEAFRSALWTLLAHPLRSFLTLLGIVIGITAIISVIAIINGLNLYVEDNLGNLGKGVFVINRYGLISNREEFLEALRRNRRLRLADARALKQRVTLAREVAAEVHHTTAVTWRDRSVTGVDIGGITPSILEIEPYDVERGRILTPAEGRRAARVAFLGWDVADQLFGSLNALGRKVIIGGSRFEVVGVAARRGSVMGFSRDIFLKIPIGAHQKLFGSRRSINISVQARDEASVAAAIDQCRTVLRARHHLGYHDKDDFGIYSSDGINELWRNLTRILFTVALFVVGLSLVVGGIVIMNIMLVSVIERTREIGLRKALGATRADIRRQFLVESVLLSAVGGALGVTLAYAISLALRAHTPLPAAFPLWAPVLAVTLCTAIGIFFGLQPAAKAAGLDPIEALQWES